VLTKFNGQRIEVSWLVHSLYLAVVSVTLNSVWQCRVQTLDYSSRRREDCGDASIHERL